MRILDSLGYRRRRRAIQTDWQQRHHKVRDLNVGYQTPAQTEVEAAHRALWSPFGTRFTLDTLRIGYGASGRADPRLVPEEIFAADIDRILNPHEWAGFFSHKSLYARLFPNLPFPECFLHCLGGDYFDRDLQPIGSEAVARIIDGLTYPVVLKPNTDSSGGAGITFPKSPDELRRDAADKQNFLVQPLIEQHPFLAAFNTHGLNTLRVYTYRSVLTHEVHVLNAALRMGKDGSLDNETAGGIVCYIHPDGRLNDYAVDKYGVPFSEHPNTRIRFDGALVVPRFAEMQALCAKMATYIPHMHLLGWDMILTADNEWKCIEVNLSGHTIRFAQYAGQPFFGEFTQEVIDYCLKHPRFHHVIRRMF